MPAIGRNQGRFRNDKYLNFVLSHNPEHNRASPISAKKKMEKMDLRLSGYHLLCQVSGKILIKAS
jgi:hypothetical protein